MRKMQSFQHGNIISRLNLNRLSLQGFLGVTLALLFVVASPLTATPNLLSPQDQATSLARSGQYKQAIAILEPLHQQQPLNNKLTNDLIAIYSWNSQYHQAVSLYELYKTTRYPTYVQNAIIPAYRNLQQPDKALEVVDILLQNQPESLSLHRSKILLLADMGQYKEAQDVLDTIKAKTGPDEAYHRLSAYLHVGEEDWLAALSDYQRSSTVAPDDGEALRQQFSALQHVRAPAAANRILTEHLDIFSTKDRAQLLLNQAAEHLRWSTDAAMDFEETKLLTMQAMSKQIQALDLLNTDPVQAPLPSSVLFDIIVTMRNLRQLDDIDATYRLLQERGTTPNYVIAAAAGGMLANRHPDTSRVLYSQILDNQPDSSAKYNASIGLFFSLIEDEKFDDAYRLVDTMHQNEPVYQLTNDPKNRPFNDRYLDLGVYAILARLYGNQLKYAWNRADELVHNAPANSWLYEIRGEVSNAREWYRQGYYDFHYASLLAPDSLNAHAGKVDSLVSLRRFEKARPLLEAIRNKYPDEHLTKALEKDWKSSRQPDYWGDITYGNSSGPELDGDGMVASAELLSSPINDNLYIDLLYRYAWNEIIEGEETFQRYSLGLDYLLRDFNLLGRVTYNDSSLDEVGGSLMVVWTPDDFWRLTISGERFSVNTPLRALYHGIRSDSIAATVNYRWSEQRNLFLGIEGSTFTDSNDRLAGNAIFRQRFIDIPRIEIDGRIEAYASTNSLENAQYYNPEQDFSLKGALHLDHVYYRHYDKLLAQQIDVGYGVYEQKGYGSDWIGHFRYEQRYKYNHWVEILAGFEFGRHVYDGEAEPYRLVRFMIHGKF